MKTIIVPTDGYPETGNALHIASTVAAKTGEKIQLLPIADFIKRSQFTNLPIQATDAISGETHVKELMDESKPGKGAAATEYVEQIEINGEVKNVLDTTISHEVSLVVISAGLIGGRHELSAGAATEAAKGYMPANELIMDAYAEGTKGAAAAHEMPFNPVIAKVVKFTHCPVLTITHAAENMKINNIVAVANFEEGSAPLFHRISLLQQHFNGHVHLLYVNTWHHHEATNTLLTRLKALADTYALQDFTLRILDDYTYEEGIMHFSQQVKADMIALSIDKHQDISRLLSENLTAGTTRHQAKFLLTFNIE